MSAPTLSPSAPSAGAQVPSPSSGSSNGAGSDVAGATRFGMSMWFEVKVDGIVGNGHLGKWSACNGLAVKIKTEPIPSGSRYDLPRIAPVAVEYPEVTLERAVRSGEEKKIQEWLKDYVDNWVLDDEAGATTPSSSGAAGGAKAGTTVVIALFSALSGSEKSSADHLVAEWTLHNAYPVAWTGPTLSAKGSDLAIEKLTFAHGGFLHKEGDAPGNPNTAPIKIVGPEPKRETLELQFQPTDMTMDKIVRSAGALSPNVGSTESAATDPSALNIGFTIRVEGLKKVSEAREKLFDWLRPEPKTRRGKVVKETLPPLELTIGNLGPYPVIIRSVSASFKRFGKDGSPIRATFNLKFEVQPKGPKAPVSGGGST